MLASVQSMGLTGIQGYPVTVEAYCVDGMPMFEIVGLPDAAVKESRERVRAAMSACHTPFPVARLTLNLAPADVRKEGPAYDLPIALAILASMGRLDAETMAGMAAVGELSLSGGVMGVRGALSMAIAAKESGLRAIMLPASNAAEAACIEGLDVLPVAHLSEAIDHLRGRRKIEPLRAKPYAELLGEKKILCDFADVRGQKGAKRALEIAAAGGHNVLMIGPPGSGKTMMARCLPGILPDMTLEEALEVTRIHSAAGTLAADAGLMAERPFRAPHHTVSAVALVGGGTKARPGEISLAHNGVLFLDELPEFDRRVLEALRQPLENGDIVISRASGSVSYPCRVMLVAAMNPCPCGNFGSPVKKCTCTPQKVTAYLNRISEPLLDRIDLQVEVKPVEYADLSRRAPQESSAAIAERVQKAVEIQKKRFAGTDIRSNSGITSDIIGEVCRLTPDAEEMLKSAFEKLGLSARAYDRILKVARTCADLAGSADIGKSHIAQAISFRSLDRKYWNR